ncbi:ATP-binding cassette domain-containing protein [Pararhodobacter sp.]|uniref:ATP-binding cassette domain-containing protein n=1 Tax=Pararhodobacter sp. TaxID=2127056 RepID=UPI002AFDCC41|nr:ATP-binding cassette domain-containing protein [Pararhodobacter sp.]
MRLEAIDASVRFGGIQALSDVSVAVGPGEITAVVGANGSGKSTLFNAITGFVTLEKGEIRLGGQSLNRLSAHRRVHRGLSRTFQTPRIDPEQSVLEAVMAGGAGASRSRLWDACLATPRGLRDARDIEAHAWQVLHDLGLAELAHQPMGEMPMGTVRLIDVGRAIMGKPAFLLLDEPAAGLSHAEQEVLKAKIRHLAEQGVGVLLVEHNFRFVTDLADTMTVLQNGKVLDQGRPAEVAQRPDFIRLYLGSTGTDRPAAAPKPTRAAGAPLMTCRGLTASHGRIKVCFDVDLEVPKHGVVALLGANGAGKSSLMGAIAGLVKSGGSILLDGQEVHGLPAHRRVEKGICFVPEIRGNIFPTLRVDENLEISQRRLSGDDLGTLKTELEELFPRLHERLDSEARMLSGGEQQMLALAMALAQKPRVLLLDEPTQGLAPAVYDTLEHVIARIAGQGIGVLLAEQNAAFAARLADHVVVLAEGHVSLRADPGLLADRERLMRAYTGADTEEAA